MTKVGPRTTTITIPCSNTFLSIVNTHSRSAVAPAHSRDGFVERMVDVFAFGMSGGLRLIHNGRLQPPAEVRKPWEQHGKHDHYLTFEQVRELVDEILPGSSVKRCLFWRYVMVYQKPK